MVGDKVRCWNRNVPIGRICFVVGLILVALWLLPYVTMPASDLCWGLSHNWTPTYQNRPLKVPLMWRQEPTPAGTHSIALRRSSRRLTYLGSESIDIQDNRLKPFDSTAAMQRWKSIEPRLQQPGDWTEEFSGNTFVQTHYSCLSTHRIRLLSVHVVCFSNDGMWSAALMGSEKSVEDFQKILHNLSTLYDPT
ncbi:hypothetical protein [Tunturiibacter gelidoferens]|jgi:hypothetical protein|uniref:Uncharacterized protein n=1 Tax=Tunturiibacter gelidiferens TaxID=3069689 RepID=A0A9X0U657_9BACT|nr:hypothetical protein [Edaphobacter lichenicola]MBB5330730.1 hypothetical protein [Edaphobacter lichenicola]